MYRVVLLTCLIFNTNGQSCRRDSDCADLEPCYESYECRRRRYCTFWSPMDDETCIDTDGNSGICERNSENIVKCNTDTNTITTPSPTNEPTEIGETPSPIESCDPINGQRLRKPWHLTSKEEKDLYIEAYKILYGNGQNTDKLTKYILSHGAGASQYHGTDYFLPWHRKFLYEFESEIRNLGDRFSCFGLPYWDWTAEDGDEWNILSYGFGTIPYDSDTDEEYCIEDSIFAEDEYYVYDGEPGRRGRTPDRDGCLERKNCPPNWTRCELDDANEIIATIIDNDDYETFAEDLESGHHGGAHCRFGVDPSGLCNYYYSPQDPIFFLLHAFVDYLFAVWQDCHDYDISNTDIDDIFISTIDDSEDDPNPDHIFDLYDVDDDGVPSGSGTETVRNVWDISEMNVQYDYGDFIINSEAVDKCNQLFGNQFNSNWFPGIDELSSRRRLKKKGGPKKRRNDRDPSDRERFNDDLNGEFGKYGYDKDKINKIAKLSCEFKQLQGDGVSCRKPDNWIGCDDLDVNEYGDIDISLEELKRRGGYSLCTNSTRNQLYGFVKAQGNLIGLCEGEYDKFCDYGEEKKELYKKVRKRRNKGKRNGGDKNDRKSAAVVGNINGGVGSDGDGSEGLSKLEILEVVGVSIGVLVIWLIIKGIISCLKNCNNGSKFAKLETNDDENSRCLDTRNF